MTPKTRGKSEAARRFDKLAMRVIFIKHARKMSPPDHRAMKTVSMPRRDDAVDPSPKPNISDV
jgi:hypothetical protein